jgi:glycosyltransferase involved in cell wall biosynthesis
LSVLTPSWNAAATIERALDSILAEGDIPLECVVVDDGSTDGTADVVRSVAARDSRVVLIALPSNVGVSNARNRGLAVVRGEWLVFHDADDVMTPGGIAALMRPTADPDVRAVVGQRVWTDGERYWLSPLYDIPDIREPGRKSIATHPGLLYYASVTGKAYHRSLIPGLRFDGRVLGDQAWAISALLRAGDRIEVVGDTVFEWSRPHPDRFVETITSVARASAGGATEMTNVARTVFTTVSDEIDRCIADPATRDAVAFAYFERLLRSDLSGPVHKAIKRRDPAGADLFEAMAAFLAVVPDRHIRRSDVLVTSVLRHPAREWKAVLPSARRGYWRMVRVASRADPRMPDRIAWRRGVRPAFLLGRRGGRFAPRAASLVLSMGLLCLRLADALGGVAGTRGRRRTRSTPPAQR